MADELTTMLPSVIGTGREVLSILAEVQVEDPPAHATTLATIRVFTVRASSWAYQSGIWTEPRAFQVQAFQAFWAFPVMDFRGLLKLILAFLCPQRIKPILIDCCM